jgi:hypothetical protein
MTRGTTPYRSSPEAGRLMGLPKGLFAALRRQPPPIRVATILLESASLTSAGVYQRLQSRVTSLTTSEAETRPSEHGANMVAADRRKSIGFQRIPREFTFIDVKGRPLERRGPLNKSRWDQRLRRRLPRR